MKCISSAKVASILSLIDLNHSICDISSQTGVHYSTISRICWEHWPTHTKPSPGCPSKLSSATIRRAARLITTGKADNAAQVAKHLQDEDGTTLSLSTICCGLKEAGMKAVVKKKWLQLQNWHIKEQYHFAERHKNWTLDDWKCVIWSDETKINHLGSDGRTWVWKKKGGKLEKRMVSPTLKFGGGFLMI